MATLHLLPGGSFEAPSSRRPGRPVRRPPAPGHPGASRRIAPGVVQLPASGGRSATARPAHEPAAHGTAAHGAAVPSRAASSRARPSRAAPSQGPPPLRLTRRGRVVVRVGVGLLLALAVCAAVLLIVRPAVAATRSGPVSVRHHLVLPGETLMGIATEEVPGVDPRDTVVRIVQLNALPGVEIAAGQDLALPAP